MAYSEMTESQKTRYLNELQLLYHHRGFYVLLLSVLLFFVFSFLDYLLVPGPFFEFLQYRLAVNGFFLLLVYLNYKDVGLQYAVSIPLIAYVFSLLVWALMVARMGGVGSPYFAGFIVAIVIFTALLPLSIIQVLVSGFAGIVFYLLSVYFCCPLVDGQGYVFLNNLFFMLGFVLLVAVQSWHETTARKESFILRIKEEETAEQLDWRAELLEQEVTRRSEEHQRSEKRFRLLFEHIADDVILVSEKGELLHANPPFFEHLVLSEGADVDLVDLVEPGERERMRLDLLAPVARGEIVRGYQARMQTAEGVILDVEINGNKLERQGQVLGLQLVIRDISLRKRMEQELRQSLQVRKQTENAAIMALARLSEHRDINPHRHLERVREFSRLLAVELSGCLAYQNELSGNAPADLAMASVLHDIGKVGIPDSILFKSDPLTDKDVDMIQRHTIIGGDVIKAMETSDETSAFLEYAKNIAYFHHEKWDGSGYPFGLVGDEIPMAARIVALADSYDSMTSTGEYGEQVSHQHALNNILREAGAHFDPAVVDAFLSCSAEFERVCNTERLSSNTSVGQTSVCG